MLGFGLGLVLAGLIMLVQGTKQPSPERIEELARQQGMVYRREVVPYEGSGTAE